jgi:hypothetical protein
MNNPFEIDLEQDELEPTLYISELYKSDSDEEKSMKMSRTFLLLIHLLLKGEHTRYLYGTFVDSNKIYGDSVQIDFDNYVFGTFDAQEDTSAEELPQFNLTDNLDRQGDYKVNKYKITFSPDLIYANAGYSSLYGLLGTTVISFSDVLGNHRIIGLTSLQIDLKNSDYGLAYYYLPERINYGFEAFHTARFVFLSRGFFSNLYRFRNYGAVGSISYPLNRFYRLESGLSWLNVSSENLDNPAEESERFLTLFQVQALFMIMFFGDTQLLLKEQGTGLMF